MADYKIVVIREDRRYFSTAQGEIKSFGHAENMVRDFRKLFPSTSDYEVVLFECETVALKRVRI